jgi:hypothetical protein
MLVGVLCGFIYIFTAHARIVHERSTFARILIVYVSWLCQKLNHTRNIAKFKKLFDYSLGSAVLNDAVYLALSHQLSDDHDVA